MSTELLSFHAQAVLNICQCRAYSSYRIFFFFYKWRTSQILQCAFMWKGHWESCYLGQVSKPFYWKHVYICIWLPFTGLCKEVPIDLRGHLLLHLNSIERSRMYDFFYDNRKLGNKLSKYEAENKHKINVYLDAVLGLWSLIIIQPDTHFHFICTSTSEVDLNAVFFLFCKGFLCKSSRNRIQTLSALQKRDSQTLQLNILQDGFASLLWYVTSLL